MMNLGRTRTQKSFVRKHLSLHGTITPQEALTEFNVWRLAAIIHELRTQESWSILTGHKRSSMGRPYAEYKLVHPMFLPKAGRKAQRA